MPWIFVNKGDQQMLHIATVESVVSIHVPSGSLLRNPLMPGAQCYQAIHHPTHPAAAQASPRRAHRHAEGCKAGLDRFYVLATILVTKEYEASPCLAFRDWLQNMMQNWSWKSPKAQDEALKALLHPTRYEGLQVASGPLFQFYHSLGTFLT